MTTLADVNEYNINHHINLCGSINMLKDFKGQLAITKHKENHRQVREKKQKGKNKDLYFNINLSLEIK